MLGIDFLKNNSDKLKQNAINKNIDVDIDSIVKLYEEYIVILGEVENLRRKRNENADSVKNGEIKPNTSEFEKHVVLGRELKNALEARESILGQYNSKLHELLLLVPNIASDDTPIGKDSSNNVVMAKWGSPRTFDFNPKSHIELGHDLEIINFKKGVDVSGFRGYYLAGDGALLHHAVLLFAWNKIISKGFMPVVPPTLVKSKAFVGSGHFPFGKDEVFQIMNSGKIDSGDDAKEPLYLTGTSEPSLLSLFSDSILDEDELPKKVCALTQCYRSEVGSYGKDARGLYRMHEFMKVEQVVICKDDIAESNEWLEFMRSIAEEILQELKLPYQVVQVCTGDMGAGKFKQYDIETWMPSRNAYGETHSDSNLTNWQSQRLGIKYRTKDGQVRHAFTLNNTVIASPRILIAILENYQLKDGTIEIPETLYNYVGKKNISLYKKI